MFHLAFWTIHVIFKLVSLSVVGISFVGWLHHASNVADPKKTDGSAKGGNSLSGIVGLIHLLPTIYIILN